MPTDNPGDSKFAYSNVGNEYRIRMKEGYLTLFIQAKYANWQAKYANWS